LYIEIRNNIILDFRLNKTRIYWILQCSGWSIYAVLLIFFSFLAERLSTPLLIFHIINALYFLISTHIFRNYLVKNRWLSQPPAKLIPKVLLATLILSVSNSVYQIVLDVILTDQSLTSELTIFTMFVLVFTIWVFYFLWALIYFIYIYFEKINQSLKNEAAIYEIELNNLKSQLNPHFMFNALNSIRALIDEDPQKSKSAVTKLSNILRNSLVQNRRKLIDFNDELKTVTDFLDLELIRYEERLQVELDVAPEAQNYQIPPLMLQTLVENGIKHGVSKLKEGGRISISVQIDNSLLKIAVRNSGQLNNSAIDGSGSGYGIENTKKRLSLIYGNSASFVICNEDDKTVLTEISIPQNI
jgi:two-component system LytT family sensor kinase